MLSCYNVAETPDEANIGKNIGSGALRAIRDTTFDNDDVETEAHTVGGGRMSFGCLKAPTLLEGHEGAAKPAPENTLISVANVRLLASAGAGTVILAEIVVASLCKVTPCLTGSCYFNLKVVESESCSEEGSNCSGTGL